MSYHKFQGLEEFVVSDAKRNSTSVLTSDLAEPKLEPAAGLWPEPAALEAHQVPSLGAVADPCTGWIQAGSRVICTR